MGDKHPGAGGRLDPTDTAATNLLLAVYTVVATTSASTADL